MLHDRAWKIDSNNDNSNSKEQSPFAERYWHIPYLVQEPTVLYVDYQAPFGGTKFVQATLASTIPIYTLTSTLVILSWLPRPDIEGVTDVSLVIITFSLRQFGTCSRQVT
jgi:hypothetical protein